MPPEDVIGSDNLEDRLPNSTISSSSSDVGPAFNKDATNAPEIGEEEEASDQYAQTYPALIDKHLLSRKSIYAFFIIAILFISGFIFIQDNGANKLNEWRDIWWSIQKCSFLWLLFILYLFVQFISWLWKGKKRRGR